MVQDVASSSYQILVYPFSAVPLSPLSPTLSPRDIVKQLREDLGVTAGGEGVQVWAREDEEWVLLFRFVP
jgi:hypothetical protein